MKKIIAYENVFKRENIKEFTFEDLIHNPKNIFLGFQKINYNNQLDYIRNLPNKEERNQLKRNFLPAVDLSFCQVLSIDIDNILTDLSKKNEIISKLKTRSDLFSLKESVSGNLVAFFKYDCTVSDYPFLYYKIYLELVLFLSVNIDFLPEIGRLRYVSLGETYHYNDDCEVLTEILKVDDLPYINTSTPKNKARKIIFGSN